MSFKTIQLEDVVKRVKVGFVGSCSAYYCDKNSGIPMIRTTNLTDNGIEYSDLKYVTQEFHDKNIKSQLKKGDILVARHGDNGKACVYEKDTEANCLNVVIIEPDDEKAHPRFIKYLFDSPQVKSQVSAAVVGSVQNVVNTKTIAKLLIPLPSRLEQNIIVDILKSIDDKIELNNSINKSLQEIAQALFKRWFVDFEFPNQNGEPYRSSGGELEDSELGAIPKGWKIGSLGQVIKVKHGYAFKSENFSDEKTKRILLTPGNFKVGGGFNDKKLKYHSDDADIPLDFILKTGDMLITMTDLSKSGDTLGFPAILPDISDSIILHNQRLGRVIFNTDLPIKGYVYNVLCSKQYRGYILGSATGSTVKHTAPNRIENYKIVIPDKELLKKFEYIMEKVFNQLSLVYSENSNLSMMRDILLPKLMSGEMRMPIAHKSLYAAHNDEQLLVAESKTNYFTT